MSRFLVFVFVFCSVFSAHAENQELRLRRLEAHVETLKTSFAQEAQFRAKPASRVAAMAQRLRFLDVMVVAVPDNVFGLGVYFPGVIVVDSQLNDESDEVIAFILSHEYGHHLAQHWRAAMGRALALSQDKGIEDPVKILELLDGNPAPAQSHQQEFEADKLAKELMIYNKLWSPAEVRRLFQGTLKRHESLSHPSSVDRLKALHIQP